MKDRYRDVTTWTVPRSRCPRGRPSIQCLRRIQARGIIVVTPTWYTTWTPSRKFYNASSVRQGHGTWSLIRIQEDFLVIRSAYFTLKRVDRDWTTEKRVGYEDVGEFRMKLLSGADYKKELLKSPFYWWVACLLYLANTNSAHWYAAHSGNYNIVYNIGPSRGRKSKGECPVISSKLKSSNLSTRRQMD